LSLTPPVMCEHMREWHQATPMFSSPGECSATAQVVQSTKDAETEGSVGASEAAAAAGMRPPKPSSCGATTKKQKETWHHGEHPTQRFTFGPHGTPAAAGAAGAAEDWQMGNAGTEAAATAAGGAAEDEPRAAAEAGAYRVGPPAKPANWPAMANIQRRHWYKQGRKKWH